MSYHESPERKKAAAAQKNIKSAQTRWLNKASNISAWEANNGEYYYDGIRQYLGSRNVITAL